jgi:tetratricopeptide (TPR) repeat protein/predicted Ser/Thr protein kinase
VACLDETQFVAYFDFRLSPEDTARLFEHIDGCSSCAQLFAHVAAVARDSAALGATERGERSERKRGSAEPVARPTEAQPDRATRPESPRARDRSEPLALGRYPIERILGMGGMGVVYAARDPELDRPVAIKLLRPDSHVAIGTLRARLQREAQAMAKLSHPNVVTVYEIGTFGEQLFVVMERIDGVTLAAWLRQRPRSWREIADAFAVAGAGLQAAHRAGIVHRDFKPDNVLVGKDGRVCVTDFGLARRIGDGGGEARGASPVALDLTATDGGLVVGTPAFMSPEQMRGEATDARSDIFSFCVALYFALYGNRPYAGKSVDELRAAIEAGQLQRPARPVGPRALQQVIERGLRARPDERPPSLAPILAELSRTGRRRLRATTAAAALLVVAAGAFVGQREHARAQLCRGAATQLAGAWDATRKAELERAFGAVEAPWSAAARASTVAALDDYARRWSAMRTDACVATRLRGDQSEQLLDLRNACLDDRAHELAALTRILVEPGGRALDKAVSLAQSLPPLEPCADTRALLERVPPPTEPDARLRLYALEKRAAEEHQLRNAGRYRDARKIVDELLPEARALGHAPLLARLVYADAVLRRQSDDPLAEARYHEAARWAEQAHDDLQLADAWHGLAGHFIGQGKDHTKAQLWIDYADAALRRNGTDPEKSLARLSVLAEMAQNQRRSADAAALYQRLAQLDADRNRPIDQADALANLGFALWDQGKPDEGLATCRRALAIIEQHDGVGSPTSIYALQCLAAVASGDLRYEEALAVLEKMRAIEERQHGPESSWVATAIVNIGSQKFELGRFADALADFRRAEALYQRVTPPVEAPQTLFGEGACLVGLGRAKEAVPILERALPRAIAEHDPDTIAEVHFALGRALWDGGGDRVRAHALATQARGEFAGFAPLRYNRARLSMIDAWLATHK